MNESAIIDIFLNKYGLKVGDRVEIKVENRKVEGLIMPKHIFSEPDVLVIKMDNGYNIGIKISKIEEVKKIKMEYARKESILRSSIHIRDSLPRIKILAVGGTILSKVDYRTGGVRSAVDPRELVDIIPEVVNIAEIDTEVIMSKYSEHLTHNDWRFISEKVYEAYKGNYDGIVILHGTDTLGYTSAALSFSVRGIPIPVILVGSQRSSDRPSSDAAINLLSALYAAGHIKFSGVFVAMHINTSDDEVGIHIGTRVRKNHTSMRSAFQSIGLPPIAIIRNYSKIEYDDIVSDLVMLNERGRDNLIFKPNFSKGVALIKFYPGMSPEIFKFLAEDHKVIIIEGTGLGHVSDRVIDTLKPIIRDGTRVYMTSQCIWGRVNMNVYDTGRELLRIGVQPLEDMLSETAYVKASWILGNYSEDALDELMLTNLANEMLNRSLVRMS